MGDDKKVSFGFSKFKVQPKVIKPIGQSTEKSAQKSSNAIQYIDCLENQSIKIRNEIIEEKKELVIPLKKNIIQIKNEADRDVKQEREELNNVCVNIKVEAPGDSGENVPDNISNEESKKSFNANLKIKTEQALEEDPNSLEAQARRELIADLAKSTDIENQPKIFALPLTSNAPKEGEKESTLDDYENIPIQEFGMAMLRGMGWKAEDAKNKSKVPDVILRPKGLGLGADKNANVTNEKRLNSEDLKLVKGCFVKIVGGMYKNNYGKLESFNEDSGRIVIKLALGDEFATVSETLVQKVNQMEYEKNSRVINIQKYEEYKDKDGAEVETSKFSKSSTEDVEKHESRKSYKDTKFEETRHEREEKKNYKRKYQDSSNDREKRETSKSTKNYAYESSSKHKHSYSSDDNDSEDYQRLKSKNSKYEKSKRNYSPDEDRREHKNYSSNKSSKKYSKSESSSDSEDEKYSKSSKHKKQVEKKHDKYRETTKISSRDKKKRRSTSSDDSEQDIRIKKHRNHRSSSDSDYVKKKKKKSKRSRYNSSESEEEVKRRKNKYREESKSRGKKSKKYSDTDSDDGHRKHKSKSGRR